MNYIKEYEVTLLEDNVDKRFQEGCFQIDDVKNHKLHKPDLTEKTDKQ